MEFGVFPAFYSVVFLLLVFSVAGQVTTIVRYAGGGTSTGGGQPFFTVRFNGTYNLWFRSSNNQLFSAESGFHRVRNFVDTGTANAYIYVGSMAGVAGNTDALQTSGSYK